MPILRIAHDRRAQCGVSSLDDAFACRLRKQGAIRRFSRDNRRDKVFIREYRNGDRGGPPCRPPGKPLRCRRHRLHGFFMRNTPGDPIGDTLSWPRSKACAIATADAATLAARLSLRNSVPSGTRRSRS
jgi:hypothetical protein